MFSPIQNRRDGFREKNSWIYTGFIAGCQQLFCVYRKNTSESQVYKVYYMNSSANKLVEKTYKTETSDTLVLMRELMQQMNTRQKKEDCEVIKPEQVRLDHVTFDSSKSTANIYFSREYNECDNSVKLLLNAGIVKMLTQINGVSYVQF